MHIYAITRGYYRDVARFIDDFSAQPWPFPNFKGGDTIQTGVRPIQLWEFIVPKEQLDMALRTVSISPRTEFSPSMRYLTWALRKLLKAKQVPEIDLSPNLPKRIVWNRALECTPIGIKEDEIHPEGYEML